MLRLLPLECPETAIEAQLPSAFDTSEAIADIAQMLQNATVPEEVQAMRILTGMISPFLDIRRSDISAYRSEMELVYPEAQEVKKLQIGHDQYKRLASVWQTIDDLLVGATS